MRAPRRLPEQRFVKLLNRLLRVKAGNIVCDVERYDVLILDKFFNSSSVWRLILGPLIQDDALMIDIVRDTVDPRLLTFMILRIEEEKIDGMRIPSWVRLLTTRAIPHRLLDDYGKIEIAVGTKIPTRS